MIRVFISMLSLAALFLLTSATSATKEAYLKNKERYSKIQKNLHCQDYYHQILISDNKFGDESVKAYFKNQRIELIVSETFGEIGKIRHEYYFDAKGELIVASNQLFTYKNRTQKTDLAKNTENRFYYSHKRLIKWVNEKNEVISLRNPDALPRSKYLLGKSMMITTKLKENDEVIGQYQQNRNATQLAGQQYAQSNTSGS